MLCTQMQGKYVIKKLGDPQNITNNTKGCIGQFNWPISSILDLPQGTEVLKRLPSKTKTSNAKWTRKPLVYRESNFF